MSKSYHDLANDMLKHLADIANDQRERGHGLSVDNDIRIAGPSAIATALLALVDVLTPPVDRVGSFVDTNAWDCYVLSNESDGCFTVGEVAVGGAAFIVHAAHLSLDEAIAYRDRLIRTHQERT